MGNYRSVHSARVVCWSIVRLLRRVVQLASVFTRGISERYFIQRNRHNSSRRLVRVCRDRRSASVSVASRERRTPPNQRFKANASNRGRREFARRCLSRTTRLTSTTLYARSRNEETAAGNDGGYGNDDHRHRNNGHLTRGSAPPPAEESSSGGSGGCATTTIISLRVSAVLPIGFPID